MLTKSIGQMYPWCDFTKNYIRGICYHKCSYCYVPKTRAARFYTGKPQLIEKELTENLGSGKTIFIGSMTDMFGSWISAEWIERILKHCRKYPHNTYLFQSKNPIRFLESLNHFPIHTIFGTTIETDNQDTICQYSKAPDVYYCRVLAMEKLGSQYDKMISIEPIMNFDVDIMLDWIHAIKPKFVSIGADSKHHHLPEPSAEKIQRLIAGLGNIETKLKNNLRRLGVW